MSLRIHVAVGGRFHSDQFVEALHQGHHDTHLWTTFFRSRFPNITRSKIHPFILPEIIFRIARKFGLEARGDRLKMELFGRQIEKKILELPKADIMVGWSSFVLEPFRRKVAKRLVLVRDSAHILFQMDILSEEHERLSIPFPDRGFCIERELEEYERADRIIVLSNFAKNTFIQRGIPHSKISILRLGANTSIFFPRPNLETRLPLKVVFFGALSIRKGVRYLLEATQSFSPKEVQVFLVGPLEPLLRNILRKYPHAKIMGHLPHKDLAPFIRLMDVFVFPTLDDGFGQVVIQAMASGLLPITTPNCGAGEWIEHGKSGWIVPVQNSNAIKECLKSLIQDPFLLSKMRIEASKIRQQITWERYQKDVRTLVEEISLSHSSQLKTSPLSNRELGI